MTTQAKDIARLVALVFETAGELRRLGDQEAGAVGQTQARWQVLSVVSDGEWTVPRAARRLGIKRQSVQRTVDVLEADGLVKLRGNPHHARSPLVELTTVGRETLNRINEVAERWHQHVAQTLDPGTIKAAQTVLEHMLDSARTDDRHT